MEGLFKVVSVYRTTIKGKSISDPDRSKVEVTLAYHTVGFNAQTNTNTIRKQYRQIVFFDAEADSCQFLPGMWILASLNDAGFVSRNPAEEGRMVTQTYINRGVIIENWDEF